MRVSVNVTSDSCSFYLGHGVITFRRLFKRIDQSIKTFIKSSDNKPFSLSYISISIFERNLRLSFYRISETENR